MKTANLPGLTPEAAVHRWTAKYRTTAITSASPAGLVAALQIGVEPDWVDCNEPFAYCCIECGSTGPRSVRCCRNDYCVVIDRRLSSSAYTGWSSLRPRKNDNRVRRDFSLLKPAHLGFGGTA
jgi:hypothetical protein